MNPTPIEESHSELAALRERLSKHQAEGAAIDQALATAIERARAARLSMQEIAVDVGVTRQTLYITAKRAKARGSAPEPPARHSKHPTT